MLVLRPATLEDAAAIAHVHVQSWRTTYVDIVPQPALDALDETQRTADWRLWLTWDSPVLVALLNGTLVGFAAGGRLRQPLATSTQATHDAELYTLYLLAGAQRQGIGSALLRELARTLTTRGFQTLVAWVFTGNPSAAFYTASGAQLVSTNAEEMAGVQVSTEAYAWPSLATLASPS